MLRLDDEYVWDSWVADDGTLRHLFFLQAPRALGHPGRRHTSARVGHATSTDLTHWTRHGTALAPSRRGWDDLAIWTGSVARGPDGGWRMYYTALGTSGLGHRDQRIGLAESDDLTHWRRVGDAPVVSADPRWYATVDGDASETWRDPFVFADPDGDGWHMLITARVAGGTRHDDGVLGHARSADMLTWEVQPPVSTPAGFGHLEVPQVRVVDGSPLLVFTCHPDEQSPARRAAGSWCTWTVGGARSLSGPWDVTGAQPFRADPGLFGAPLVAQRDGSWALLGFANLGTEADLPFVIGDPIPVRRDGNTLI